MRVALVPAAALLVHQLRFMLAFGSGAGAELARQGHSYLHSLVPWIVLLIGVAVGGFLWALGRALYGQRSVPRYTLSLAALWLVCSVSLVGIYVAQEFLEGLFATGHPAGLAGIFGYGGWWSIPAAVCVGLVLAAILHGARWVLDEVGERRRRVVPVYGRVRPGCPARVMPGCRGSRRWRTAGRVAALLAEIAHALPLGSSRTDHAGVSAIGARDAARRIPRSGSLTTPPPSSVKDRLAAQLEGQIDEPRARHAHAHARVRRQLADPSTD